MKSLKINFLKIKAFIQINKHIFLVIFIIGLLGLCIYSSYVRTKHILVKMSNDKYAQIDTNILKNDFANCINKKVINRAIIYEKNSFTINKKLFEYFSLNMYLIEVNNLIYFNMNIENFSLTTYTTTITPLKIAMKNSLSFLINQKSYNINEYFSWTYNNI